ncbi:MAG: hypothetical protein JKY55_13720 [Aliivibrio sp.]|uniref:hypothetical protein n=1 Tax=Aliivibrio sp. TaxID=1872443 RepID=UPI001A5F6293|nr:hypothetical protein [Aliivibrio sp.]
MKLHNQTGEVVNMADDLTLKEIIEMGFTIDLCDEAFDPNEHWQANEQHKGHQGEFPES